ncbi:MAG: hypothetical protein E6I08_11420 [Chloroflexi bacterium]|nr:MAG: hypothetical protein E6I08_11420 [Chloroflexota bacterium]
MISKLAPWALLVPIDIVLGIGNVKATDDVQPVAAGLLVAAFGYGFWRPRQAWLFALLLFAAIPISSAWSGNAGHPLYETLIALIPAGLGAAAGYGVRTILVASRASNMR